MAKVPTSQCAIGVNAEFIKAFPKDQQKMAEDFVRNLFRLSGDASQAAETRAVIVTDAFIRTLQRTVQEPAEKGLVESWISKTQLPMVGPKGARKSDQQMEVRNQGLMHQHRRLPGEVSILSQTRQLGVAKRQMGAADPFTPGMVSELIVRLNSYDGLFRVSGIPVVTMRPTGDHVSHLSVGDIFKILHSPDVNRTDTIINGFLRNNSATENIPLQNLAEAVRRITQHNDDRLAFEGEDLAKLDADVLDALLNAMGKPVNDEAKAGLEATRKWMMSDEGRVILGDVKDALMSNWQKFVKEDMKQRQIALVFQQADGIKMTQQVLDTLVATPWNQGDRVEALGGLFFDDWLRKVMGNDTMVKMSPDGINLAFGHQFLAKVLAQLAPEQQAVIREYWANTKAARADARKGAGKPGQQRTERNKGRKKKNDEIAEASQKMAEDGVQNDPNKAVSEPTPEAAVLAHTFYNELHYGSMVGGLAKALGKVSDRFTMTSAGKTLLMNAEHVRLENAAVMAAGLRKLNDGLGQDAERANRIYKEISNKLGRDENTIEDIIAGLEEADRGPAKTMIEYIDAMFGVGYNNSLMRNGIFVDDLIENLKAVGLREQSDALKADRIAYPDELMDYWRRIVPKEGENVLDLMSKFYSAQQLSMIPPTLADSLARHFSHTAEGIDAATAAKQGWFALPDESPLGKYMNYGQKEKILFPPEFMGRFKAMEEYLDYNRSIGSGRLADIVRKVDQVTSVLKSSITLWRPGHHMVSLVGNIFMNTLAGVQPYDYMIAVKLLKNRGDIFDVDDQALNEFMRLNAPAGTQMKTEVLDNVRLPIKQGGKTSYVSLDMASINIAMERYAAYINPRRVRDVVTTDDLGSGQFSASRLLTKNPVARGIEGVDHQLARIAAIRDNVARAALFVKELRKMSPKSSLDEAFIEAASRVHEYHPTVGTLTAPERKYARRLFYFYTWQKQAFFKILEFTANRPAVVTIPSKLQYAIATAQGLDPLSFGDPYNANGLFAAYNSNSLYGPQWDSEEYGLMGIKPPVPQLDVIDSYLSGIRTKPENGLWENVGLLAETAAQQILVAQSAPAFRIPAELAIGRRVGTDQEITNLGEYAIDQTGLGSLSRIYDWTPWGPRSDTKLDPYADFNRERQWWNYLGGMRITAYESPASLTRARQEWIDYWQKTNQAGKFAPKISLQQYEQMIEEQNVGDGAATN